MHSCKKYEIKCFFPLVQDARSVMYITAPTIKHKVTTPLYRAIPGRSVKSRVLATLSVLGLVTTPEAMAVSSPSDRIHSKLKLAAIVGFTQKRVVQVEIILIHYGSVSCSFLIFWSNHYNQRKLIYDSDVMI